MLYDSPAIRMNEFNDRRWQRYRTDAQIFQRNPLRSQLAWDADVIESEPFPVLNDLEFWQWVDDELGRAVVHATLLQTTRKRQWRHAVVLVVSQRISFIENGGRLVKLNLIIYRLRTPDTFWRLNASTARRVLLARIWFWTCQVNNKCQNAHKFH